MINKLEKFFLKMRFSIAPLTTLLISIFISILPYHSTNLSIIIPLFSYTIIYFWKIYRPYSLSYFTIFILGLLKDVIENDVLGLNALCLLLFSFMVKSQRKYIIKNAFVVVWAGFIFFLTIIILISMMLVYMSSNIDLYPFKIVFAQWLITIFVYVPIHFLLSKLNSSLHE